jgi:hypothetical protein
MDEAAAELSTADETRAELTTAEDEAAAELSIAEEEAKALETIADEVEASGVAALLRTTEETTAEETTTEEELLVKGAAEEMATAELQALPPYCPHATEEVAGVSTAEETIVLTAELEAAGVVDLMAAGVEDTTTLVEEILGGVGVLYGVSELQSKPMLWKPISQASWSPLWWEPR